MHDLLFARNAQAPQDSRRSGSVDGDDGFTIFHQNQASGRICPPVDDNLCEHELPHRACWHRCDLSSSMEKHPHRASQTVTGGLKESVDGSQRTACIASVATIFSWARGSHWPLMGVSECLLWVPSSLIVCQQRGVAMGINVAMSKQSVSLKLIARFLDEAKGNGRTAPPPTTIFRHHHQRQQKRGSGFGLFIMKQLVLSMNAAFL